MDVVVLSVMNIMSDTEQLAFVLNHETGMQHTRQMVMQSKTSMSSKKVHVLNTTLILSSEKLPSSKEQLLYRASPSCSHKNQHQLTWDRAAARQFATATTLTVSRLYLVPSYPFY